MKLVKHTLSILTNLTWVLASQASAQEYSVPLYYDANTGNLTMDVTEIPSGTLQSYVIKLGFPGIIPENYTPVMSTVFGGATEYTIGETDFGEGVAGAVYSLGDIFPTGLSEDDFTSYFTRQDSHFTPPYQSVLGELGTQTSYDFQLIHSPSPFPPANLEGSSGVPDHPRWAEDVSLLYDPADGSLTLDASGERGGALAMYFVESPLFDLDAFVGINADYSQAAHDIISEVGFGGIPEGVYNLGSVLPIGLSSDELDAAITTASFIGLPGHSAGALDIGSVGLAMSLAVVPEPGSCVPTFMALLGLLMLTRRFH